MFLPLRIIFHHIEVAYNVFDTINRQPYGTIEDLPEYRQQLQKYNDEIKHRYFILPIILMIYWVSDTGYQLWTKNFDYFGYPHEDMFSHQIYPKQFWLESDIIANTIIITSIFLYLGLYLRPFIPTKFYMFIVEGKLIVNNKAWNSENGEKLMKFRSRTKYGLKVFYIVSYSLLYTYFCINFWLTVSVNTRNVLNIFVIFPVMFYYTSYGVLFFMLSFYIALRYLMIKQIYLLDRIRGFFKQIAGQQYLSIKLHRILYRFNRLFIYQCNEIAQYNKFWTFYITLQFQSVTILVCYMAYCLLFIDSSLGQKIYYWYFLILLFSTLSLILWRCSSVDFYNEAFAKIRIKILLSCKKTQSLHSLFNLEKICCNFYGGKYCFNFGKGYNIDSNFLSLAIVVITTLFMKIIQNSLYRK